MPDFAVRVTRRVTVYEASTMWLMTSTEAAVVAIVAACALLLA